MRHAILVVGSKAQSKLPLPELSLRGGEAVRISKWFAGRRGNEDGILVDDIGSAVIRLALVPLLSYKIYALVQNTKLWSGKRPLLLVRDTKLASRIAAYAGTWGGGDVVKADRTDEAPLRPTRYVLAADNSLVMIGGDEVE